MHKHSDHLEPLPEYNLKDLYPNTKCLSSSQFKRYEEDPAKFYVEYVLGIRGEPTVKMQQGVIFSALYANRKLDYKAHLHNCHAPARVGDIFGEVIKRFPVLKGGHPEFPLIGKHGGWKFRATLDDFVEKLLVIVENKTGEKEWTQERSDNDDQVTFQAWCHWKEYGVVPKKIILNWVDLRRNTSRRLWTFTTKRTLKQLQAFEERVDYVIENIEAGNFTKSLY